MPRLQPNDSYHTILPNTPHGIGRTTRRVSTMVTDKMMESQRGQRVLHKIQPTMTTPVMTLDEIKQHSNPPKRLLPDMIDALTEELNMYPNG